METQQVKLRKVPVDTVRQAKSVAVLSGRTLEQYLTDLLVKIHYKKGKPHARQNKA